MSFPINSNVKIKIKLIALALMLGAIGISFAGWRASASDSGQRLVERLRAWGMPASIARTVVTSGASSGGAGSLSAAFPSAMSASLPALLAARGGGSAANAATHPLAQRFPALSKKLSARAEFSPAQERVGGRAVEGLRARPRAGANHEGLNAPAGLKPQEQEAWLQMARRQGAAGSQELASFYPARYGEPFVVEGQGVRVAVRPVGGAAARAEIEQGQVVYRDAYAETDSLHVVGAGRSEEFLSLRSESAPREFAYELSELSAGTRVELVNGEVRFTNKAGRGVKIEAPWLIEANGARRADAVRWELDAAQSEAGPQRLRLMVAAGLSYPAVIDPSWIWADSLGTARDSHTATLLQSGKVLVAGGENGSGPLSSAELYDPATGMWTTTGSLGAARYGHTATLLQSGKVLVAGGFNGSNLSSAELYDPATGMWTTTGSLAAARKAHTATLLQSGKVLVAGGLNDSAVLSSAELYNPATGTWTTTSSLAAARDGHTATLLPSGLVLVAGGLNGSADLSSAERYIENLPPGIFSWGVFLTAGAGSSNSQIASVNDAEDALNTLSVTVNGAASATTNGVTVSNITVTAVGQVYADVMAACGASNATFTLRVTDSGGLFTETTLPAIPENIPPVVTCPANVVATLPPNSMDTGTVVNYPAPTATDYCTASPAITTSKASGSVFPVGVTTVTVTATDAANNQATCSFTVTVLYNFSGFLPPVKSLPTVNVVNAGKAVTINFSLSGNKGLSIFAAGYPASQQIGCVGGAPVGPIVPTVTAGSSGLSYDAGTDTYSYFWKTDKSWAGTCRQLILKLNDGSQYVANFMFK
jgi:hypothetical protein